MVFVCVDFAGDARRELCEVHCHVPTMKLIDDQSGFALFGIGVVSMPGAVSANAIAVDASAVATRVREIRKSPERIIVLLKRNARMRLAFRAVHGIPSGRGNVCASRTGVLR